jgi:purine-binding chemotaxis protein CheW
MSTVAEAGAREIEEAQQFLTFMLNEQEFGIDILQVQEIRNYTRVTAIPNSPENISGVINLRGAVIPIVDLRRTFQMPATQYDAFTVIVVVNISTKVVGLIVDAVTDVFDVCESDIEAPPNLGSDEGATVLSGIAKSGDRLVGLLDIGRFLSDEFRLVASEPNL